MEIKINGKYHYQFKEMCEILGFKNRKSLYDAIQRGEIEKIHVGSVFRKV